MIVNSLNYLNVNNSSPRQVLINEIRKGKTPSVQYVFFNSDDVLFEFCEGFADIGKGIESSRNTTFPIFSVTKTFTATSILQLAEKGLLNPDYPVRYYLPELEINPVITVKHLLTHTAGLPNPLPIRWIHLIEQNGQFSRNDFFRPILVRSIKNTSPAGIRFRYSNLGFVLLGLIIEKITELSYEQYVIKNILSKLRLKPETIAFEIPHLQNFAVGYHSRRSISMLLLAMLLDTSKFMGASEGNWKPFKPVYVNGTSYGGLIANTPGMVRYAREFLKPENKLLSAESMKIMFTENRLSDGRNSGMCTSWFTGRLGSQTYYSHAGGGGGFYCELRLYPEISSGSFIIFNRSGFSDERFLNKIDGAFL